MHPISECFDCEFPHDHGINDATYDRDIYIFDIWFITTTFIATLLRIRRGWTVPFGILFAFIATQHLGGLPWWSLRDNEGPTILLVGIPVSLMTLTIGFLVRESVPWIRRLAQLAGRKPHPHHQRPESEQR
jgi:hypothetical protein